MTNEFSPAFSTAFDAELLAGCECENCVPWDACMDCCAEWDDLDPSLQCRATVLAWSTLRGLTGGQVGNCPVVMRPCLTPPCNICNANWMNPMIVGGDWFNIPCGCTNECSCERLCEIVLPGPVAELTSVLLDGNELPLGLFRIDNGNRLVRQDGECWPSCQDMTRPLGDPGTLGIEYVPGIKPNAAGLWAAGVLACEFSKACAGGKCRLPAAVTSVARQGVTFDFSQGMFPNGQTGIREVDAYILSVNPNGLKGPSLVYSPDLPQAKHRYTTWAGV